MQVGVWIWGPRSIPTPMRVGLAGAVSSTGWLVTGPRAFMFELYETANSAHCLVGHLACLPQLPALHYRVSRFQSSRAHSGGHRLARARLSFLRNAPGRRVRVKQQANRGFLSDISCLITNKAAIPSWLESRNRLLYPVGRHNLAQDGPLHNNGTRPILASHGPTAVTFTGAGRWGFLEADTATIGSLLAVDDMDMLPSTLLEP